MRMWREQNQIALGVVDSIRAGFSQGWDDIFDESVQGSQRLDRVFDRIKSSFVGMVGQMAAEWLKKQLIMVAVTLTSEKTKQAAMAETSSVETALALKSIVIKLKDAAATIVGAIASGFKWLVSTLGPFGLAAGIGLGASLIAAFAAIKKQLGFALGGMVQGKGGPREDNIPIWVSNGEYVVNARATSRFLPILEAINNYGKGLPSKMLNGFAGGGFVSGGAGDTGTIQRELRLLREDIRNLQLVGTMNYGGQLS